MSFLRRDLRRFGLLKPTGQTDSGGDDYNTYDDPPVFMFHGNLQPVGERENPAAYGLDPKYSYAVYVEPGGDFRELDRATDGETTYEIKTVQRWSDHWRLMVEEVRGDGRF